MRDYASELPSAYSVTPGKNGRFYPRRFGALRRNADGSIISFDNPLDAITYCWSEQARYERRYPAPGDTR